MGRGKDTSDTVLTLKKVKIKPSELCKTYSSIMLENESSKREKD